jgi:hypothetical protein
MGLPYLPRAARLPGNHFPEVGEPRAGLLFSGIGALSGQESDRRGHYDGVWCRADPAGPVFGRSTKIRRRQRLARREERFSRDSHSVGPISGRRSRRASEPAWTALGQIVLNGRHARPLTTAPSIDSSPVTVRVKDPRGTCCPREVTPFATFGCGVLREPARSGSGGPGTSVNGSQDGSRPGEGGRPLVGGRPAMPDDDRSFGWTTGRRRYGSPPGPTSVTLE